MIFYRCILVPTASNDDIIKELHIEKSWDTNISQVLSHDFNLNVEGHHDLTFPLLNPVVMDSSIHYMSTYWTDELMTKILNRIIAFQSVDCIVIGSNYSLFLDDIEISIIHPAHRIMKSTIASIQEFIS